MNKNLISCNSITSLWEKANSKKLSLRDVEKKEIYDLNKKEGCLNRVI